MVITVRCIMNINDKHKAKRSNRYTNEREKSQSISLQIIINSERKKETIKQIESN